MGSSRPSLMFRLGQFFGHVARGATGPVARGPNSEASRRVVRHEVEQHTAQGDGATVTLRRTTIEEIEVRPEAPEGSGRGGAGD